MTYELESFVCFLCGGDAEFETEEEAVDHLVEKHDQERDDAERIVGSLTEE